MLSPEPDFDRLIEIEQREHGSMSNQTESREPLARKLRPGESNDGEARTPESRFADRGTRPASSEVLPDDPEFQDAYADASPTERALLDKFGTALLNRNKEQDDPADNTPRTQVPDSGDTQFRLSDMEGNSPPTESGSGSPIDGQQLSQNRPIKKQPTASTAEHSTTDDVDRKVQPASHQSRSETPNPQRMGPETGEVTTAYSPAQNEPDLSRYDLRELGHAMIAKLEAEQGSLASPDQQVDAAKKRRLLNLVLDDLESAAEPIDGLQDKANYYLSNTMQGLHDATDIEGNPVASRRLTLALRSHRNASQNLSDLANLEVLNLAFCTEVDSFGVIRKFNRNDFRPDQEVLLYCELENFVSEKVEAGYQTQIQGSYEIVDQDGRRVADQLLPEDLDLCGNRRRDFYIAYRFRMPDRIEPGHYQLRLTIEDMKGHKFGQSKIDFEVLR